MYIIQIASECAPVAKVGGLADVVFGLTRELEIRGHAVEIILPKYDCMRYDQIHGLHVVYQDLYVPWYNGVIHTTVFSGLCAGESASSLTRIPTTISSIVARSTGRSMMTNDSPSSVARRWSSC